MPPDFALIGRQCIRLPGLPDGMFKMLALCTGLAAMATPAGIAEDEGGLLQEDRHFRPPPGGWGAALGTTERNARRWRSGLLHLNILLHEPEAAWDRRGPYVLPFASPEWRIWESPLCRLPLGFIAALSPAEFRLWAVLWSYRDDRGLAWPSQATLAAECGVHARKIRERLAALQAAGVVRLQRRRGTTVHFLPEPETGGQKRPVMRTKTAGGKDKNGRSARTKTAGEIEHEKELEIEIRDGARPLPRPRPEGDRYSLESLIQEAEARADDAEAARLRRRFGA